MERARRLAGADRREQVLKIAAEEFAVHGLHGVSAEVIARKAGITHAYVFRLFGTKKQLFLEVVRRAFAAMAGGLAEAAGPAAGLEALAAMGRRDDASLSDRTLLLQLQAFAACGDAEVRAAVCRSPVRLGRQVLEQPDVDAGGGLGSPAATGPRTTAVGRLLVPALMFIALVVAVVGSLGAPLITSVAGDFGVSLAAAQWTLTAPLLVGAIATPVLWRLGTGPRRRQVILAALAVVVAGSLLTVVPPSFGWLLAVIG
ncbi:hypothetical protein AQI88_07440 [Streptomyces cellostaticus]|uniref:HTH tetR-type domain-containing protein n=1 Tax=Streptomyces cellostaticus TaxID=67285 RepID=A0A117PXV1_9ACTN|nr:hypothetical protein AQI88_07440 [Streptomyces cellostaticus]GHI04125.1 hypothetical protein Scel_24460 [Streptomyces cellostaticus]